MLNDNIKIESNELTIQSDLINIIQPPKHKSEIILNGLVIYLEHEFNWFNRKMIKLILGLNIVKVKDDRDSRRII